MDPIQPSHAERTSWYRGLSPGDHLIKIIHKNATPEEAGYDRAAWHPPVVIIWLGSNDFSTPVQAIEAWTPAELRRAFERSYRSFVTDMRRRIGPAAPSIAVRPRPEENQANQELAQIVEQLRSQRDQLLYYLQFPRLERTGCDSHPTLAGHCVISATLARFIEDDARRP
jgi:hypothetical protein